MSKDPTDTEKENRREWTRGSDEAIVSDDVTGQNNPMPSQGPLGRNARAGLCQPSHSGRQTADRIDRATTVYTRPPVRGAAKVTAGATGLKPYWGKPAVRNFREGRGNVMLVWRPFATKPQRADTTEAADLTIGAPLLYSTEPSRQQQRRREESIRISASLRPALRPHSAACTGRAAPLSSAGRRP